MTSLKEKLIAALLNFLSRPKYIQLVYEGLADPYSLYRYIGNRVRLEIDPKKDFVWQVAYLTTPYALPFKVRRQGVSRIPLSSVLGCQVVNNEDDGIIFIRSYCQLRVYFRMPDGRTDLVVFGFSNKEEAEKWRESILGAKRSITPERKTSPHTLPVPALA